MLIQTLEVFGTLLSFMSSLTQEESDDDDGEMYEDLDERW